MQKIYIIRASGGEWSDSWTSNICAKYCVEDAEQYIKDLILNNAKAKQDLSILQKEEDRWEEENDYEYEDTIPLFTATNKEEELKLSKIKAINEEINQENIKNHQEFYEKFEAHMEQFAKDNNLTRGGSEYEDTYYTIDEIEIS